jgi:hypothetical protein
MWARCTNPSNHRYKHYGAQGIEVCEEWSQFSTFWEWAKKSGYQDGLTIERSDNDGDYTPENCTWIPKRSQQRNTQKSLRVTAWGETKVLPEWIEDDRCSIKYHTLYARLQHGWTPEDAIGLPYGARGRVPVSRNALNSGQFLQGPNETSTISNVVNHLQNRLGPQHGEEHFVVQSGSGRILSRLKGRPGAGEIDTGKIPTKRLAGNISVHNHPGVSKGALCPHSENDLTNALAVGERRSIVVTKPGVHTVEVRHPTDERDHPDFERLLDKAERLEQDLPIRPTPHNEKQYGQAVHGRLGQLAQEHSRWMSYHFEPHESEV